MKLSKVFATPVVAAGIVCASGGGLAHEKGPAPGTTLQVNSDIAVEWDGTVERVLPDPAHQGFPTFRAIGSVTTPQALAALRSIRESFVEQYPVESLEGGRVLFEADRQSGDCRLVADASGRWLPSAVSPATCGAIASSLNVLDINLG